MDIEGCHGNTKSGIDWRTRWVNTLPNGVNERQQGAYWKSEQKMVEINVWSALLGGIIPVAGLFFWTSSSTPTWESRNIWPPPRFLSHLLALPPSPPPPLCRLEKGNSTLRNLKNRSIAFCALVTFIKWAYSLNTFHRSRYSPSCLRRALNRMTAYIKRCWFRTALTSPFMSGIIEVVTGVKSF